MGFGAAVRPMAGVWFGAATHPQGEDWSSLGDWTSLGHAANASTYSRVTSPKRRSPPSDGSPILPHTPRSRSGWTVRSSRVPDSSSLSWGIRTPEA